MSSNYNQTFALIIGNDQYAVLNPLAGCINDATKFKDYLRSLNVPDNNIKLFTNATRIEILKYFDEYLLNNPNIKKAASPTLIFYFAGHGGYVQAPKGWPAQAIETICPVDDFTSPNGKLVFGIPDITLNAKLQQLADSKGDNIIVILDCCHSGGATRDFELLPENVTIRGTAIEYRLNGQPVDFKVLDDEKELLEKADAIHFSKFQGGQSSHVLLAACHETQLAHENTKPEDGSCSGIFTSALIRELKTRNQASLTYVELMDTLRPYISETLASLYQPLALARTPPTQDPTCHGLNKDRWLFEVESRSQLSVEPAFLLEQGINHVNKHQHFSIVDARAHSYRLIVHSVDETTCVLKFDPADCPQGSALFGDIKKLEVSPSSSNPPKRSGAMPSGETQAGDIPTHISTAAHIPASQPVTAAFTVRVGQMHQVTKDSRFILRLNDDHHAILKVHKIGQRSSVLMFEDEDSGSYERVTAKAAVTWPVGSLRVRLADIAAESNNLTSLKNVFKSAHLHNFTLIDGPDADVEISFDAGSKLLKVKRFEPLFLQLAGKADFDETSLPVEDASDIPAKLDQIAHFHYHLGSLASSSKARITNLGTRGEIGLQLHELKSNCENFREPKGDKDYFCPRTVDSELHYGIKIFKKSDGCVYVSLFCFDPKTYEIQIYAQSEDRNDCLLDRAHQGSIMHDNVRGRKELTVGYGPGGRNPIKFEKGERVFFKLFASGEYRDLKFIEESGVFHGRPGRPSVTKEVDFKDAWVVGVVVKD